MSGLTLRRMLETAVGDGAKKLRLQQEVTEAGRVNADVAALLVDIVAGSSCVAFLSVGGASGGLGGVELLVGVIDQILLVRHVGGRLIVCRMVPSGKEMSGSRKWGNVNKQRGDATGRRGSAVTKFGV